MHNSVFDILLEPNNPVLLSILITVIIMFVTFFFYKHLLMPMRHKHEREKSEMETRQLKMMALFADLDPDPVIRIDQTGMVIYLNNIAGNFPEFSIMLNKNISELLQPEGVNIPDLIKNNSSYIYSQYINGKFYTIHIKGSSYLNMGHIYLHDISNLKKTEDTLKQSRSKLRELTQNLMRVSEKERIRIAKELHDGIGQNMLFMKLQLQQLKDSNGIPDTDETYNNIICLFDDTLKDLKNIIYDLKPKILEEMGLAEAVKYLAGQISYDSKITGRTDINISGERLGREKEIFIFRIVQELFNNIVKHSGAKNFFLQIAQENNIIKIIVSDDGKGFSYKEAKKKNKGFGLRNLAERVSYLNGTLKIDSSQNTGTTIIAEIPGD